MSRATYVPITCKSAVNRVKGMPFKWSLNPYRGCVHACQYCYARETHTWFGLNAGTDFERAIFYKSNIANALRKDVSAASWAGESIAIGTATDAYQPIEGSLRLTRACLQVLLEARNPLSIVTKSTLIRRDIDLLSEIQQVAGARVYFTITTLDRALWRELEPGTPPPQRRLETMRLLSEAGIATGVLMAPVVPGLTDNAPAIDSVAAAAAEHGASSFTALPLRLAPLVKEHFLNFIVGRHPDLYPWYARNFRTDHPPEFWKQKVEGLSADACRQFELSRREDSPQPPPLTPVHQSLQLQLL